MTILGISAFYHDSAAALVEDGRVVAAAQEERFTRRKHDASFPAHAVAYCLAERGIGLERVDRVVFYDKPILKFDRILETYLGVAPRGFRQFLMAGPLWIKEKLFQKDELEGVIMLHRMVANNKDSVEATEQLIKLLKRTPNNTVFLDSVVQRTRATL